MQSVFYFFFVNKETTFCYLRKKISLLDRDIFHFPYLIAHFSLVIDWPTHQQMTNEK